MPALRCWLVLLLVSAWPCSAFAADSETQKFGPVAVVDYGRVLKGVEKYQPIFQELQTSRTELSKREADRRTLSARLEKAARNSDEFAQLTRELAEVSAARTKLTDVIKPLMDKERVLERDSYEAIRSAVMAVAEEHGIDVIFRTDGAGRTEINYYRERVDITSAVIKKFNENDAKGK
ncbi:OmpH family outer membrane protein [Anatilimnocola floriformis]|uniref:OmpH family outer membrane protein n=1 Tax=Anatilimnocola floriformis TaxID=2948575 RepID=UPI0020C4B16D|nr:OmpH family outer membrane protein [Anatilimnocola floriformis]